MYKRQVYLYSAFTRKALRYRRITQFYLQITPYLPLPIVNVHQMAPPQTEVADI